MAKVATAYVEIKPDLDKFATELNEKLKAIPPVAAVNVNADVAAGIKRAARSAKTKAAVADAGEDIGEDLSDAIMREMGKLSIIDDKDMTAQSKRLADLVSDDVMETSGEDAGKVWVKGYRDTVKKEVSDQTLLPLRAMTAEQKLNARITAEAFIDQYRATFKDNEGRLLPIDKAAMVRIEREMIAKFPDIGSSVTRAFAAGIQRDWDRMLAEALTDNRTFNLLKKQKEQFDRDLAQAYKMNDRWDEIAQKSRDDWAKTLQSAWKMDARYEAMTQADKDAWDRKLAIAWEMNRKWDEIAQKSKDNWDKTLAIAYGMDRAHDKKIADKIKADFDKMVAEAWADNKAFNAAIQKGKIDYDRAIAKAWGNNSAIDNVIRKMAKQTANTATKQFVAALGAVTNGWSRLLANPIGAVLALVAAEVIGSFVSVLAAELTLGLAGIGILVATGLLLKGDKAVQEAASSLGRTFTESFTKAVLPARKGLLKAFDTIEDAIPGLASRFSDLSTGLSDDFDTLAKGAVGFVDGLISGLKAGLPGIKQSLQSLADLGERLGDAIGEVIAKLGKDPERLKKAFDDVSTAVIFLVDTLGTLIDYGIDTWNALTDIASALFTISRITSGPVRSIAEWLGIDDQDAIKIAINAPLVNLIGIIEKINAGPSVMGHIERDLTEAEKALIAAKVAAEEAATAWEIFGEEGQDALAQVSASTRDAVKAVETLIDQMNILDDAFMDSREAESKFLEIQDKINETIKKGKKGWDLHTAAGRANQDMVVDQANVLEKRIKAELKNGASLAEVTEIFNEQRAAIIKNAEKLGAGEEAAIAFADSLHLLPENLLIAMQIAGVPEATEKLADLTKERLVNVKPGVQRDALVDVLGYLAFVMTEAGRTSGKTFDVWLAEGLKVNAPVVKKAGKEVGDQAVLGVEGVKPAALNAGKDVAGDVKKGVSSQESAVRSAGAGLGKEATKGVATNYSAARTAGQKIGYEAANAVDAPANKAAANKGGKTLGNQAKSGAGSVSLYGPAISMGHSLVAGLDAYRNMHLVGKSAAQLAAQAAAQFPNSPKAKEGPLAGKGDFFYKGQRMAKSLAAGLVSEVDTVSKASQTLAGGLATPFASATTLGAIEQAQQVVNVYIGSERLDERIDYKVATSNDDIARALLAGRSGV